MFVSRPVDALFVPSSPFFTYFLVLSVYVLGVAMIQIPLGGDIPEFCVFWLSIQQPNWDEFLQDRGNSILTQVAVNIVGVRFSPCQQLCEFQFGGQFTSQNGAPFQRDPSGAHI